jgi:hypothetical protein
MHRIFMILPMLLYLFIFIVGLLNAINPRWMWETFESWKATKEPTKVFFRVRRISGVVTMIIISCVALFPYMMSRLHP